MGASSRSQGRSGRHGTFSGCGVLRHGLDEGSRHLLRREFATACSSVRRRYSGRVLLLLLLAGTVLLQLLLLLLLGTAGLLLLLLLALAARLLAFLRQHAFHSFTTGQQHGHACASKEALRLHQVLHLQRVNCAQAHAAAGSGRRLLVWQV